MVAAFEPLKLFDFSQLEKIYTWQNPGQIGTREVPGGKLPRAIHNVNIVEYNFSRPYGDVLNSYVNSKPKGVDVYGSPVDFVAGGEVGSKFLDDLSNAYSSSHGDAVLAGADYTAFDVTERFENARVYQYKGTVDALSELGFTDFAGVDGGLVSIMKKLFGKGIAYGGIFISGKMPLGFIEKYFGDRTPSAKEANEIAERENFKFRVFELDQLRSGELITLAMNSINNHCNFKAFFERFKPEYMHLTRLRVQGDDSLLTWKLEPGQEFTKERYSEYVDTLTDVTSKNGLSIKKTKFLLRQTLVEFLQVTWLYGILLPKPVVQPFASEKVAEFEDYASRSQTYVGKSSTLVSRGISINTARLYNFYLNAFALRSLQSGSNPGKITAYYYPQMAMYAPKLHKGTGNVPWCPIGANMDAVLVAWYTNMSASQKLLVETAIAVLSARINNEKDRMADLLNSDSTRVTPNNPFLNGRNFLKTTMPYDRVLISQQLEPLLSEIGLKIKSLAYYRLPYETIRLSIQSNATLRELNVRNRSGYANAAWEIAKKGIRIPFDRGYEWVTAYRFKTGPEIDDVMDPRITPVSSLDPRLESIYVKLGIIKSKELFSVSPSRLLAILSRDRYFPTTIREESLIQILSHPSIYGNRNLIEMALVTIGARYDLAAQVANQFLNDTASFVFRTNIGGISLGDAAISNTDLSRESHERVVKFIQTTNRNLDDTLRMLGMAISISESILSGSMHEVHVEAGSLSLHKSNIALMGAKLTTLANKYNTLNPKRDWEK